MFSTEELRDKLSPSLAEEVAADIAKAFITKASTENLELEFRIPSQSGRMESSLDEANTWFKFDADDDNSLQTAKKIINEVFGEDFDLDKTEDVSNMKEREIIIDGFREHVRIILNSGVFHEEIATSIRKNAMGDVPASLHPLDVIRFLEVEIGEANDDEFLLVIEKRAVADPATGQFLNPPASVHEELFAIYRETGKDFSEIIAEKHAAGDERFDLVSGATRKRYSFDVHCDIAVDYSLGTAPQNVTTT